MKKLDVGVYSLKGKSIAVVTGNSMFGKPKVAISKSATDSDVSHWGDDNLYPQRFLEKYAKTDAAIGGIEVLTTAHFGNGFKLYEEIEDENGVSYRQRSTKSFPEIHDFFKSVKWPMFMSGVITDFEMWRLVFPEFILSPNKDKIINVRHHTTSWCRFGVPSEKTGWVDKVIINSDWQNHDKELDVDIDLIPDKWATPEEVKEYVKKKNIKSFILPITGYKASEKLYPNTGWHSAFNNGWVDTVLSVPEFKKWMFINQLHFKYVVYISDEFMSRKYGQQDWEEFTPEEREKKREELVNLIDEHMSGSEAAGRSLISPHFQDMNGNLMKGIEINPIDDKIKDGNFLPDAAAGNSQINYAQGVDPCLIGSGTPGGKNLSGSGSDKREAYTILCAKMPMKRIHTVEIFNFIRDYNGWNPDLIGNFPNLTLTTLDKNPTGKIEQAY